VTEKEAERKRQRDSEKQTETDREAVVRGTHHFRRLGKNERSSGKRREGRVGGSESDYLLTK
jgi:hypothetical protein